MVLVEAHLLVEGLDDALDVRARERLRVEAPEDRQDVLAEPASVVADGADAALLSIGEPPSHHFATVAPEPLGPGGRLGLGGLRHARAPRGEKLALLVLALLHRLGVELRALRGGLSAGRYAVARG